MGIYRYQSVVSWIESVPGNYYFSCEYTIHNSPANLCDFLAWEIDVAAVIGAFLFEEVIDAESGITVERIVNLAAVGGIYLGDYSDLPEGCSTYDIGAYSLSIY